MISPSIRRLAFILCAWVTLISPRVFAQETHTPPGAYIVFFTPSDVTPPPGVRPRLTQAAEACEKFYFHWMKYWGYPPGVTGLFPREADGLVKVLYLQGDQPVASGKYDKPNYGEELKRRAIDQYHLNGNGSVFWIFVYLGSPPKRFADFRGIGNPVAGGQAMANYDDSPGELEPGAGLATGFNGKFFLKGCLHELGHSFGLPHVGPDPELGLGNSLMGPTTAAYARRGYTNGDRIYLSESSAAMLWKHPLFSGTDKDLNVLPAAKLADYHAAYDPARDVTVISGKLVTGLPAHSVILFDDQGKPKDEYWHRGYTARIAEDGTFKIQIQKPPKVAGHYRILFCFNNGVVSGNGRDVRFVDRGDIRKSYKYKNGGFEYGD